MKQTICTFLNENAKHVCILCASADGISYVHLVKDLERTSHLGLDTYYILCFVYYCSVCPVLCVGKELRFN